MKGSLVNFQLGKAGLTESFIESLLKTFKNHELVKVSILKSCCRDRQEAKNLALGICQKLEKLENKRFTLRLVGYTMFIRKWRKKF
jgi:RNA-binding protein YhbY